MFLNMRLDIKKKLSKLIFQQIILLSVIYIGIFELSESGTSQVKEFVKA